MEQASKEGRKKEAGGKTHINDEGAARGEKSAGRKWWQKYLKEKKDRGQQRTLKGAEKRENKGEQRREWQGVGRRK